jgi:hypothetical protein
MKWIAIRWERHVVRTGVRESHRSRLEIHKWQPQGSYRNVLSIFQLGWITEGEERWQNYVFSYIFNAALSLFSRSQWTRGLRHEPSSPARTLGSWVRIPLKGWRSVCVYSVLCVGSGVVKGWSPVKGILPTMYMIKKLKKRPMSEGLWSHRDRQSVSSLHSADDGIIN